MTPWIPFDADADEIQELSIVSERVPPSMRGLLESWTIAGLDDGYGTVRGDLFDLIQSSFRIDLGMRESNVLDTTLLLDNIQHLGGEKLLLRVVDLLLSVEPRDRYASESATPKRVRHLETHLELNGSALSVVKRGETFRLAERLPQGVELAAEEAANAADATAGKHLALAWDALSQLEPDAERAFTEGIKAVELASHKVVLPKAKKVRLSNVVQALKDKKDWRLVLEQRDDGHPDHRAVLVGMLETLALSQTGRHGGDGNSAEEARAHVMLASLLVGWFATGAVIMEP